MAVDPLLIERFEGEYKPTAGFSAYTDKKEELNQSIKLASTMFPANSNSYDNDDHQNHPPLPGPRPVTVTSFKELRDMKLRSVVPKFGK